jgi:hypothetical protein
MSEVEERLVVLSTSDAYSCGKVRLPTFRLIAKDNRSAGVVITGRCTATRDGTLLRVHVRPSFFHAIVPALMVIIAWPSEFIILIVAFSYLVLLIVTNATAEMAYRDLRAALDG